MQELDADQFKTKKKIEYIENNFSDIKTEIKDYLNYHDKSLDIKIKK